MKKIIILLIMALLCASVSASEHYKISGTIVDESRQPLPNVTVDVRGKQLLTDQYGRFSTVVKPADIYRLNISRQGYYPTIQTHSHYELNVRSNYEFNIAPIELVEKKKGRTMMAFGGDVMMGRRYAKPYFNNPILIAQGQESEDTKAIVRHIKPYMEIADFAAVNLETQLATHEPEQRAPKSVTFFSPPQTLSALEYAGIDYVTLGNNHTYDYMDSGLKSTLKYLKNSKLGYSGAGFNQTQALKPYHTKLNGTDYAMLGFVGWEGGFTPNQTAGEDKGGAAFGSLANITASVAKASEAGKAAVVQYHGSQEYADEPTVMTEQRLKSAIDNGADLAIAHHPHVAQGFEIYEGKLIAYSMGNFIFDQFFYSTPHSFVLYVWMDGEQFHRAEVVPVYLKGYKPTPSTGVNRFTVLKRLTELSKKRGVTITASGGHGIIRAQATPDTQPVVHQLKGTSAGKIYHLPMQSWQSVLNRIDSADKTLRYRLGLNLVNGSDFENYATFNSPERGWNIDQNSFAITKEQAFSGQHAMKATLSAQTGDELAMTNFRRVYRKGNPMSVQLKVKVTQDTTLRVMWQGRKTRDKFFRALNERPRNEIAVIELSGKQGWQTIEVPFNSPRVGYRSLRVMAQFDNKADVQNDVFVDDFSLIEWQSAFAPISQPVRAQHSSTQASFIAFDRQLASKEQVTLSYQ